MGVVHKFTAERRKRILDSIRAGNTITHAAGAAKVGRQTVYNWLEKGHEEESGPYREFADAVEEAQSLSAEELVEIVREAGRDDWRAAMTMLERRFPDEYAKSQRHEVSGPKGQPVKIVLEWPKGPPEPEPET